jgi:hypothetical protein
LRVQLERAANGNLADLKAVGEHMRGLRNSFFEEVKHADLKASTVAGFSSAIATATLGTLAVRSQPLPDDARIAAGLMLLSYLGCLAFTTRALWPRGSMELREEQARFAYHAHLEEQFDSPRQLMNAALAESNFGLIKSDTDLCWRLAKVAKAKYEAIRASIVFALLVLLLSVATLALLLDVIR